MKHPERCPFLSFDGVDVHLSRRARFSCRRLYRSARRSGCFPDLARRTVVGYVADLVRGVANEDGLFVGYRQ